MNNSIEIITTGDGSQSLINKELNETYHSTYGALQESRYVFIQQGLNHFMESNPQSIDILEIGFGTGLNVLLTIDAAENIQKPVRFTTVDNFPLPESVWKELNYDTDSAAQFFDQIHRCSWDKTHAVKQDFELTKINMRLQALNLADAAFDIVYFDAFAPSKQPEMWGPAVLEKMFSALRSGGILVTYCAKGQVKRDLKAIGFEVETLEGPPGKKEMIRAIKP